MSADDLIEQWIQYLKNNRIAAMSSDPDTGKLRYLKQPTSKDIIHFLDIKTDFNVKDILNAIKIVKQQGGNTSAAPALPNKEPGKEVSTWHHTEITPADRPEQRSSTSNDVSTRSAPTGNSNSTSTRKTGRSKFGYNSDNVSDIDYKDIPPDRDTPPKKSKSRFWFKEDISEKKGIELDEKEIEAIFKILSSGKASDSNQNSERKRKNKEQSPEEIQAKKEEDLRKFKRIIRDVMTDAQRKSFWRMLNDVETLEESQINNADIKAILKTVADQRNNPTGFRKIFKGLRKDKIDVNDLQQAWKSEGYPDDLRDIKALLLGHGFSEAEIKKALTSVFGEQGIDREEGEPDVTTQSPVLLKMVKYIKKNNLTQDIIDFMAKEFDFTESLKSQKIMIEDIRQVFSTIVHENRSNRDALISQQDSANLGRMKK